MDKFTPKGILFRFCSISYGLEAFWINLMDIIQNNLEFERRKCDE